MFRVLGKDEFKDIFKKLKEKKILLLGHGACCDNSLQPSSTFMFNLFYSALIKFINGNATINYNKYC